MEKMTMIIAARVPALQATQTSTTAMLRLAVEQYRPTLRHYRSDTAMPAQLWRLL